MEENKNNPNLDTPQPELESAAARRIRLLGIENNDKIHDTEVEIKKGSFFANFWYKHNWAVLISSFFIILAIVLLCTIIFKDRPDLRISYNGPMEIGNVEYRKITKAFEELIDDYDGDGEIEVTLTQNRYRTAKEKKDADRQSIDIMKDVKQIIAKNLVDLRKKHGLTQNELAQKLNYSDNAVSRWERGELAPSVEVLQSISEVYGVEIDALLRENITNEIEKDSKTQRINKMATIILIVSIIWCVVALLYVYSYKIFHLNLWRAFCWAVPISCVVLLPFNDYWGKYIYKFVILSVFVWTTLTCIYLQFLVYNLWLIFIVGIPAQIALVIWAFIKPKTR